jgi:hypothetical protein
VSDGVDEEDRDLPLAIALTGVPAWLLSLVVHLVGLVILALLTLAVDSEKDQRVITAFSEQETTELELFEPVEMEVELEQTETPSESLDVNAQLLDTSDLAASIDPSDVAVDVSLDAVATFDTSSLLQDLDSIGGRRGIPGGEAMFFGTKSKGRRIAFVVDNSNSMGRGRLETALIELTRAVERMESNQQFFIVFFSDTAYPMLHPRGVKKMLPATVENKRKIEYWLETVQRCLRTDGLEAVNMALTLRPDVIYILGDGAFTDRTARELTRRKLPGVTIHTLGMQVKANVEESFRQIAVQHKGTYKDVGVSAVGLQMFRRSPRPANRNRGKVWGLKLPPKK